MPALLVDVLSEVGRWVRVEMENVRFRVRPGPREFGVALGYHLREANTRRAGTLALVHRVLADMGQCALAFLIIPFPLSHVRRHFLDRRSLTLAMQGMPRHITKQIATQVLAGLDYLHRCCNVVHTGKRPCIRVSPSSV